jgi:hypothetical protein
VQIDNHSEDRFGSNATEPFGPGPDQCLLFFASDQISYKSGMMKRANSVIGRGPTILPERERIKRETTQHRRLLHKTHAA